MTDIIIDKAILHILDTKIATPVLADKLMSYSMQADEFLKAHLARAMEDSDGKKGHFDSAPNAASEAFKMAMDHLEPENFIKLSKQIAQNIFDMAISNPAIPASDVLMCHFQYEGAVYLGILKFNYKQSYIHQFTMAGEEKETGIIQQNATIANENQKLEEFVIIQLDNLNVLIKEKKYEINGVKEFYLSTQILNVTTDLSPKSKVKIVEKTAEKIIKEYYGEDPLKVSQLKTELKNCVEENSVIEIDRITNAVFDGNHSAQQRYKDEISNKGISSKSFDVPSEMEKSVSRKQKITTDTGIEISLPIDYLENQKKIEFIMNEDGTMSILIKAVNIR